MSTWKWKLNQKWNMTTYLLLLLLLSHFSRVQLCATLKMAAHHAPPSLGFSRQEHWSGLPLPSPMHESENWKWSRSVESDSKWPHGLQPTRLLFPWDFPGKSTGVGCHCLLLLEWPKSKTLTISKAAKNVELLLLNADGNAKYYNHLGRQFGNFLQN